MKTLALIAALVLASASCSAAVAFRAESHVTGTTANANPGEPTGTASGDVLIALVLVDGTCAAPSLPSGWTSLYPVTSTRGTTANGFKVAVGWIARNGSAVATTFTNCATYEEAYIISISGGNNSALDSTSASGGTATAANHPPDPPSTTAVAANCLSIAGGVHWGGSLAGGWTASTGYTIRSTNTAGFDGFLETKLLVSAGAENPGAVANQPTGTSFDYWDGFTLTVAPPGGATPVIMPPRVM